MEINEDTVKGCGLIAIVAFVGVVILGLVLSFCMPLLGGWSATYSDGHRVGVITKFSNKGYVIKSWEGQMVTGGMVANDKGVLSPEVFEFSVVDMAMVSQIEAAMSSGKRVKLHYVQVWSRNAWKANTDYYAIKVETLDDDKGQK
jgi:hypothetical protein